MTAVVDPQEVQIVRKLVDEQRLDLVEGTTKIFPGLSVTRLGGHTPGQLMVQVDSGVGEVVLASDAAHYWSGPSVWTSQRPWPRLRHSRDRGHEVPHPG